MSFDQSGMNDPLSFMRNMWGNMGMNLPGMVAPTFDVEELDKRIKDMKAVEGWLRMNLSMLQMTIQGLEMQRTTVAAVHAMGQMASDAAKQGDAATAGAVPPAGGDPAASASALSDAALWPWQMMQQMREQMEQHAAAAGAAAPAPEAAKEAAPRRRKS